MPDFNTKVDSTVLRESLRARVTVAPVAVLVTFISVVLYIPIFITPKTLFIQYIVWAGLMNVFIIARAILSRGILTRLHEYNDSELRRADQQLRISSICNQLLMGLGVWMVPSPTPDSIIVPLFMTLVLVAWTIGVMANLFSDFRSYFYSISLMVAANASFWFMQSYMGVTIGLAMILSSLFGVLLVRRGTTIFRESVLMRFEKDQLLEAVQLERENTQRALREAQAANDSKAYFMAAASHDIKQPLHALGLLTDALLMSDPPEFAVPILKSQKESISQMSAHFDALIDMGRFQGGQFELHLTRVSLGSLAARIDREIAPLCADKGLAWNLQICEAVVSTDEQLLLRVLRNLLVNAVQYTEHGEVCCTARAADEFVEFVIWDTGCGIAPEYQKAVFREFVRLNENGARSSGAGLGLSIVDKISQALGLGLQMASTPGKGTRFSFRLPTRIAA